MNLEMTVENIELRWVSDEGWTSVTAKKKFKKGDVVEICPVILLDQKESRLVEATWLKAACCKVKRKLVLPGGYGGVYLPSENPNASFEVLPKERALVITANQTINSGEHIYVNRGVLPISKPKIEYNEPTNWHSDGLVVKPSPGRGLGTFTTKSFKKGEFVEVGYFHRFSERESFILSKTKIENFMYSDGSRSQLGRWALGYPCFYNYPNNDEKPNINPWKKLDHIQYWNIAVQALTDLKPDTELVFDYYAGYKTKDPGFEVK